MGNLNTTTVVPQGVDYYFKTDLLMRAVASFVYVQFASLSKNIPKRNGLDIKWRRHANLLPKTTPITEGVTPVGSLMSQEDITTTVKQYGDYLEMTDVLEFTTDDPDLNDWNKIQADQASDTFDVVTRSEIYGGSTIQYASTAVSRVTVAAAMKLDTDEVIEAQTTLKNNKAKYLRKIIAASVKYNTTPIPNAFIGFIHPNTTEDVEKEPSWVPIEKYAQGSYIVEQEVGKLKQTRFVETTQCPIYAGAGAAAIDVYATLIIAQGAYGVARLAGESMENIFKTRGSGGTNDPMNQRSTKAWVGWFAAKRLNEDFMVRIEHSTSSS